MAEASVRIVPSQRHAALLAEQVARLRQEGPVILVSFMRTCDHWRKELGAGEDLFFVDVTGHGPPGIAFGVDVHYVDSPVKLELVALVLDRVVRRLGGGQIVIDDLGTACMVNNVGATVEFAHLLINRSRQQGCPLHLFLSDAASPALADALRGLAVDSTETLA
ncbi:MAG: hypothetical protein ACPHID_01990 [Thermoplasmatota archaeon]